MSDTLECNYCTLHKITMLGKAQNQDVTIIPAGNRNFPDAKEVTLGGDFIAWFAILPEKCACEGIRRIS